VANAPSRRRPEGGRRRGRCMLCTDGACSERHGDDKSERRKKNYCVLRMHCEERRTKQVERCVGETDDGPGVWGGVVRSAQRETERQREWRARGEREWRSS
jgi:hypothetical protein